MQKLFRSLIAIGGLAGLVACGDDVTVGGPAFAISGAPVTAVSVGAKVQLTANKPATWTTSAASVATVDATGLVTAVGQGTASITATATSGGEQASVTITVAASVRSVTVTPPNAIIKPGETVALVANVDADAGIARTVNWTSSNTAVATVSNAGVVTGVTPGAATITAASTVASSVVGAAAITVRAPLPATISLQNITITGTAGQTANNNNIFGSIDVNMNVDPGEQVVTRVDVIIDNNTTTPACSQNLSGAQSEALRVAAAFEQVEDVIVSCQINTAAFAAATGIALYPNGQHTLSVIARIAGGDDKATPSTALTFNNQSGVTVVVTNNNGTDPATAIHPTTGLSWIGGAITLNVVGVSYTAGTTVASVNCSLFGKTVNIPLTNGTATVTWTETSTPWTAGNTQVGGYLSTGPESVSCTSANLSNGQPMTVGGAGQPTTPLLNFGAPGTTNAAMPALQVLRLDNSAPGVASANSVAQPAITMGAMTGVWVNAATTFGAGQLGVPTTSALNATDLGVDNVTATVNIGATLTGANTSCNLTGLTARTSASGLAETIVSTAYVGRVAFKDALGNTSCQDLAPGGVVSATFGADFTPPNNVTLTFSDGSTNDFFYNTTSPAVSYILASTGDNASGISATTPGLVSISRDNSVAPLVTCVVGSGTLPACNQVPAPGTANITGGSAGEGYYNLTAQMTDVAGNIAPVPAFTRRYLVDATAPTFTGNVGMNAQYSGNAPAAFTNLLANDNLDLNKLLGVVQYTTAGLNIQYPSQSIGSFGLPLEKTFSGTYTIPSLIRCINAAGNFAQDLTAEAQQIFFLATDQAGNAGVVNPVAGALSAALDNCGAVGNLPAPATINSFTDSAVVYPGTGKTQVSKSGLTTGANSATVNLTAIADVSLDNAPEPFTRVEFYRQEGPNWILIGQAGPGVLNQTVTTRTWTYKFTWDPDGTVPSAVTNVIAIGIDAQGDAVRTIGLTVTVAN